MKSLQNQYKLISEGKGKKDVFLKEAKRLYPNLLTNSSNFNEAEAILKNKGVISENIVGIPAIGSLKDSSKQDWVKIFKENLTENYKLGDRWSFDFDYDGMLKYGLQVYEDTPLEELQLLYDSFESVNYHKENEFLGRAIEELKDGNKEEAARQIVKFHNSISQLIRDYSEIERAGKGDITEAKATETKTSKEVEDVNAHGYDNADKKNLDNQIFDQYLNGLYVELKKDPELTMEKAREIVAKNLASDSLYYMKNAAFKVDGIGYADEAPGLTPKEITGKYKASGYGDLKEQKLRKAIRSIIREELNKPTAKELFNYFEEEDLIDDRGEYDLDDLMLAYPGLSKIEAQKLMKRLSQV